MFHASKRRALAREFEEQGFLVLQDILSPKNVNRVNRAVDEHLERNPDDWCRLSDSLLQCVNVLPKTDAFDFTVENPSILRILVELIGREVTFESFSIMIRNPTANLNEIKGWHRDSIRDYARRKEIDEISLIYYLTDVTENDHQFSIIPESHNRLVDLRPGQHRPEQEFDVWGPAGTVVLFHGRCIHRGKLKANSRQRRTLHIYYSRAAGPRTAEWSDIPPRLYQKADASLPPLLYSKWNCNDVLDGAGKKPRDVDPKLTPMEVFREAMRRASQEH